jgi:hypothetical protein
MRLHLPPQRPAAFTRRRASTLSFVSWLGMSLHLAALDSGLTPEKWTCEN